MSGFNIEKALADAKALGGPSWLQQWRADGAAQFASEVFPTRKTERWKYTPLRSLTQLPWSLSDQAFALTGIEFDNWPVITLNIVNGQLMNEPVLPKGVTLLSVRDADDVTARAFLAELKATKSDFYFDSLNQALLDNAYWLKVEPGVVVETPIHIDYVSTGSNSIASYQVLASIGENALATLVETYSQKNAEQTLVNANTQLQLAANAQLTHYHLLLEVGEIWHVGQVSANLARSARLSSFHMALGGKVKRKDIVVRHQGEGAQLSLNGVYLPKGEEIIDYHTAIEHEVAHCHSQEIFRGIIGDSAKAVFNGRIHIHPDAQKSIAEMNNRNLLLSDKAEIDTKSELEIYADDVRCAHGATIAQLDDDALFYFQTRGVPKAEAEVMLSFGFINELLDALEDAPVRELLRPKLAGLFSEKKDELTRHLL